MNREATIVAAVKRAHMYGGDGSSWMLYAPNHRAWFRQKEYNSAHRERHIMDSRPMRNAAMTLSTLEDNEVK